MSFRIASKSFFLTYSQCDVSREEIMAFIQGKCRNLEYCVVGQENHRDGNKHLHVLLNLSKRLDVKSQNYFDFQGFHPSIEATRNFRASKSYVMKEDLTPLEWGGQSDVTETCYEWVNDMTEGEFFEKCLREKVPFQYADHAWKLSKKPKLTLNEEEVVLTNMIATLRDFEWDWSQKLSLVVSGPSGIGKTTWVKWRAPKPALWVTHMDNLHEFREGYHKCIVFDDMSFDNWKVEHQIHLVDIFDTRSLHTRYRAITIPAGVPRVFTTNVQHLFHPEQQVQRRIKVHRF